MGVNGSEWHGENPYYLLLDLDGVGAIEIDLDKPGWVAEHNEAGHLRARGFWHLCRKDGTVAASMLVFDGEQPYYMARHVGFAPIGANGVEAQMICYGIGKKRVDGFTVRLWVLQNGIVTVGDDVEILALDFLRRGLT